jgi:hypothetical protein
MGDLGGCKMLGKGIAKVPHMGDLGGCKMWGKGIVKVPHLGDLGGCKAGDLGGKKEETGITTGLSGKQTY